MCQSDNTACSHRFCSDWRIGESQVRRSRAEVRLTSADDHVLSGLAARHPDAGICKVVNPRQASDYALLGMAQLAAERWDEAHGSLQQALDLGDTSPATQLNLALAEDRVGLAGRRRMQEVASRRPQWDEPRLRMAESLRRCGDLEAAAMAYEQALQLQPNRHEALLSLAMLLVQRGAFRRALPLLLRCCAIVPRLPDAWDALGIAFLAVGFSRAAESAFSEAQRLNPKNIPISLRRVEAAFAAGMTDTEQVRLERATSMDPLDIAQLTARGVLLDRLGRADDASNVLETAVALAPDEVLPVAALANSQLHAAKYTRAVSTLKRAVELAPNDIALRNDLAAALNRVHCYREARELIETLIVEHGDAVPLLCNLCNSLVSLGFQQEGADVARRATSLAPEQVLGWRTLANALAYCQGTRGAELLRIFQRAGALASRSGLAPPAPPREPDRRLRIGLLSGTLKTHPVGWLTLAGFEGLDPAQFDIVCFGQPPSLDLLQRRFRARASEWHTVSGKSPRQIAGSIRAANIDILIDLGGWGDQGSIVVCAERPAPIQVKWVGMQNHSTGLAEMDLFISDRWETPAGVDHLYSEQLLRLPDGYVCYTPPSYAPPVASPPALRRRGVTFGCFNNLAKITPNVLAAWSAILKQVPESRLLLKTHQFSDQPTAARIKEALLANNVEASRIEMRGSSSHRSQLEQHGDVDIVLDPFPYSGGLTTCEALWMGVPVVTTGGEIFASRHSTSHLCNVGLADWVAADEREYKDLAIRKANDILALRTLRHELRGMVRSSPLCDNRRFAAQLGMALRSAWRRACRC